mmetsp:Transcript_31099/g.66208  ORF Transcript_31099/g.66208 Transcript_31099/m.66208 type:complete len:229 (+) Transcript_31099:55-741(+)
MSDSNTGQSADAPLHNPHALDSAQDPKETFEVMQPPPSAFDPHRDRPASAGTLSTRGHVHENGLWHSSVHVWIVDPASSSVLLQRRSMSKDTFPGRWDISSAGHVEAGSASLEETARSELAEELGIEVEASELSLSFVIPAEQAPLGGCNAYEHVYFLVREGWSEARSTRRFALGAAEVSEVSWTPARELLLALRASDDGYAPRTGRYVDAMEEELTLILGDSMGVAG